MGIANKKLIKSLYESDQASELTNQAAREIERIDDEYSTLMIKAAQDIEKLKLKEIEKLKLELQTAVNERNEAWFKLEELKDKP